MNGNMTYLIYHKCLIAITFKKKLKSQMLIPSLMKMVRQIIQRKEKARYIIIQKLINSLVIFEFINKIFMNLQVVQSIRDNIQEDWWKRQENMNIKKMCSCFIVFLYLQELVLFAQLLLLLHLLPTIVSYTFYCQLYGSYCCYLGVRGCYCANNRTLCIYAILTFLYLVSFK